MTAAGKCLKTSSIFHLFTSLWPGNRKKKTGWIFIKKTQPLKPARRNKFLKSN